MKDVKIDPSPLSVFRFLGVATITLIHYSTNTGKLYSLFSSTAIGDAIIGFFYVLSGFGLFLTYHKQGTINLRRYFIKRTIRILPFYYMALFMMALILTVSGHFSFTGFFLSFFCIQTWFPNYQHTMNSPAWFVANLMFFYCIFPLIFSGIKKGTPDPGKLIFGSVLLWIFTLIILNILLSVYPETYSSFIETFPLAHFCSFYLGICGAYYVKANEIKNHLISNIKSPWYTAFLFLLFFLVALTLYHQGETIGFLKIKPFGVGMTLYSPLVLLMIINLSTARNYVIKIFSLRFFCLLGTISYPLYIFQKPVYGIYDYFIAKQIKMSPGAEFIFFLALFMVIASVLTIMEKYTLKSVFKTT